MERWVAIILGLLVVVVGFLVIQSITEGTSNIKEQGDSVECVVQGGSCVDSCPRDDTIDAACSNGATCCAQG